MVSQQVAENKARRQSLYDLTGKLYASSAGRRQNLYHVFKFQFSSLTEDNKRFVPIPIYHNYSSVFMHLATDRHWAICTISSRCAQIRPSFFAAGQGIFRFGRQASLPAPQCKTDGCREITGQTVAPALQGYAAGNHLQRTKTARSRYAAGRQSRAWFIRRSRRGGPPHRR